MSGTRAARRRELRAAGAKRSSSKRGRRSPIRATSDSSTNKEATRSVLQIARAAGIVLPNPGEILAANDRRAGGLGA